MPFMYGWQTKQVAENYATSGSANTGIDFLFIKAGATRPVGLAGLRPIGKGAALTALSGIAIRSGMWGNTTGSSGGTATTPTPVNNVAPAAAHTMGMGSAGGTGAVTSGTTTFSYAGGCGHGASGPGGWAPLNPDSLPSVDGGTASTKSIDLFSSSGQASLNFEVFGENSEFGF